MILECEAAAVALPEARAYVSAQQVQAMRRAGSACGAGQESRWLVMGSATHGHGPQRAAVVVARMTRQAMDARRVDLYAVPVLGKHMTAMQFAAALYQYGHELADVQYVIHGCPAGCEAARVLRANVPDGQQVRIYNPSKRCEEGFGRLRFEDQRAMVANAVAQAIRQERLAMRTSISHEVRDVLCASATEASYTVTAGARVKTRAAQTVWDVACMAFAPGLEL